MLLAGILICLSSAGICQDNTPKKSFERKQKITTMIANGTFEVKMTPQSEDENVGDPLIGRLAMSKQFSGDLAGTSKGQMLGSQSEEVKGSGGYVAMERFTGTLNGKKGSFILQHTGTMQGGNFDLNISVVPDSGSGELTGISGKMKIIIDGAKHSYEFEYSLPVAK
mgnify:CR=1 FL=1